MNKKLENKSGNIESKSKLDVFLYLLMRDYITPGDVGFIMKEIVQTQECTYKFTNGYLAKYAKYVRKQLNENINR